MKKKLLLLIPLASLLTGCFLVPENYETEKHQTNAYNLSAVTGETQNYSEILSNTVEYRTIKDEPLVPYLTLVDYAKLFTPFFTENTSLVATTTSLEVYLNKEPVFVAMVQFSSKRILMAGSLSETLKSNQELPPSLDFRMKYDAKLRKLYGNYSIFSYKGFDFKTFGKYLPLSVWDNVFNRELDVYTYFNYQNFYLFEDVSLLQTTSLKGDGEEKYSPFDEAHTVIDTYDEMPLHLLEYSKSSLYFIFENFYGLKSTRHISSMSEYFEGQECSANLLSPDTELRSTALSKLISDLSDGHTALSSGVTPWGDVRKTISNEIWDPRKAIMTSLVLNQISAMKQYDIDHAASEEERQAIIDNPSYSPNLNGIMYSDDNSLAFFSFLSFRIASTAIHEDGTYEEDAYKSDSFMLFKHQFEEISKVGTVKDVVINIGANGGGILAALMKVLAVISNDNHAHICLMNENLYLAEYDVSVDTNGDGVYDTDDCYGDDYNIYLLTSSYSFSCGNAFPYYAQYYGYADSIGHQSGGGECIVGASFLPNGQFINHSDLTHIGVAEEVKNNKGTVIDYTFVGDEGGCPIKEGHDIDYDYYYDVNYLAERLSVFREA